MYLSLNPVNLYPKFPRPSLTPAAGDSALALDLVILSMILHLDPLRFAAAEGAGLERSGP